MTRIELPDEAATTALGCRLAGLVEPGDLLLLQGDLGAGKTFLARALLRALADADIEVPSPTFSLAVPYHLNGLAVLHTDLYRLSDPAETEELGLEDALDDGVVLVEWPDRLDDTLRARGTLLSFATEGARHVTLSGTTPLMERFHAA